MNSIKIGLIAEDQTDYEVLNIFTCKLIEESKFKFLHHFGHGCGKLKKKCAAWAKNLVDRGCNHIVVMHDLDDNKEKVLRKSIEEKIRNINCINRLILIPIFEVEAWLLSDSNALTKTFKIQNNIKDQINNPETIKDPKKHIGELVRKNCNIRYVNSIHNKKIAQEICIDELSRKCRSFKPFQDFINRCFNN